MALCGVLVEAVRSVNTATGMLTIVFWMTIGGAAAGVLALAGTGGGVRGNLILGR